MGPWRLVGDMLGVMEEDRKGVIEGDIFVQSNQRRSL